MEEYWLTQDCFDGRNWRFLRLLGAIIEINGVREGLEGNLQNMMIMRVTDIIYFTKVYFHFYLMCVL